ncbi:Flagellin FlgL [Bosea sp. 62]|uniref:flagellar biosynthesis protein FlgL n=1 Tax=unclassified Bosea (in: a-proteobacteria) TaxID=2653178 RepID=UPI00125993C4|nr:MULTISPECIES: flagellar biosynthesis protein FlgL [unclassified Bosea (in: a-proteobacteria)]CAD5267721.1 Flagellin FlgL [Bosea sp. 46]CAD5268898.1 Flagellin FlgL [Bosea sp. 7B]CAD5269711.1 Flagellin FlgL [Bosea sp. 21B]VVT62550.1 Flagellin FlgL [Bosea sp. EC-HK365B]VXB97344.1 Flagellin FlgL [Bosea sp. 29B]
MTITPTGTGAYRLANPNQFVSMRGQLEDLQRQLATQKKSQTFAGLGMDRGTSLDLNNKLSTLDGYLTGIQRSDVNLKLMTKAVENFTKLAGETRADARPDSYVETSTGRTSPQVLAEEKFKQTLDLLNSQVNGRYLFSGRTSDVEPVVDYSLIMDGDATHAGLKQLISERKQADIGAGGMGRLVTGGAGTNATIAEEAAGLPYGFKLTGASSSTAAMTTAYNAGPPADIAVNVAAQPQPGDTLKFALKLPDGTTEEITLTARAAGTTGDPAEGFVIGADANATAANLRTAIGAALSREAKTSLSAASAQVAAKDFFAGSKSNPPLRVPGPPFDTATAAPAPGTAANTVIWYQGDDAAGSARATSNVQVDQGQQVAAGARANEEAFRTGLAQFAIMAAETFPASDPNSKLAYGAMTERVRSTIGFPTGTQAPSEIIVELGSAQTAMAQAKERHTATKDYLSTTLSGVEDITKEEVAMQILALQTTLQASYQTTSMLQQLRLTNYL